MNQVVVGMKLEEAQKAVKGPEENLIKASKDGFVPQASISVATVSAAEVAEERRQGRLKIVGLSEAEAKRAVKHMKLKDKQRHTSRLPSGVWSSMTWVQRYEFLWEQQEEHQGSKLNRIKTRLAKFQERLSFKAVDSKGTETGFLTHAALEGSETDIRSSLHVPNKVLPVKRCFPRIFFTCSKVALQKAGAVPSAATDAELLRIREELKERNEGYGEDECKICYEEVPLTKRRSLPCDLRHWVCVSCLKVKDQLSSFLLIGIHTTRIATLDVVQRTSTPDSSVLSNLRT
jgi:hypothetical protein